MPKALPRRPNLLALFPGISNDWQGQRGTESGGWGGGEQEEKEGEKQKRQWQVGAARAQDTGKRGTEG